MPKGSFTTMKYVFNGSFQPFQSGRKQENKKKMKEKQKFDMGNDQVLYQNFEIKNKIYVQ